MHATRERLQHLISASPAVIFSYTPSGQLTFISENVTSLLGYEARQFIDDPMSWFDRMHPEDRHNAIKALSSLFEEGYCTLEYRFLHKDGTYRWLRDQEMLVQERNGNPREIIGCFVDITERKRAEEALRKAHDELDIRVRDRTAELTSVNERLQLELAERKRAQEALRESEERARSIVDTAYDAFISIDVRSAITDWNRQAEVIFGWSREEAVGRRLADTIIPPELREAHELGLKHFLATGEGPVLNKRIEITALHRDGHEFPAELAVWAVGSREDCAFNAFVHDITERKQAEEALRESEERYRSLYVRTPVALHSIDADGRLVEVSDHWLELLGYERNEVIGRKSVDFMTEQSRRYAETITLPEFMNTGDARDISFQFVKKNGEIVDVLLDAITVRDEEGNYFRSLAVLADVTERKRMEEALQAARDELEGKVERQLLRRNPYGLTFRELTVLHLVAAGESDKQIGLKLGISSFTAQKHTSNILAKMGAGSRTEATARALREGLLD